MTPWTSKHLKNLERVVHSKKPLVGKGEDEQRGSQGGGVKETPREPKLGAGVVVADLMVAKKEKQTNMMLSILHVRRNGTTQRSPTLKKNSNTE